MTRHEPQTDIPGFRTGGIAERYAGRTANWSPTTPALGGYGLRWYLSAVQLRNRSAERNIA